MRYRYILLGPFTIIIIWTMISFFNLSNPLLFPNIQDVGKKLMQLLYKNEYNVHIYHSIFRFVVGYILGITIGFLIGNAMGLSNKVYNSLELVVDFFRSIPVASLFPLFLIFFGITDFGKIIIIAWSTSLIIMINTMYGVKHTNDTRILVARSFHASKMQIFLKVIFPESLPEVFVGLRQSVSIALIVVLVAEMFMGTENGLGVLIQDSALIYNIDTMYATIIFTGILGYVSNRIIILMEKRMLHWSTIVTK